MDRIIFRIFEELKKETIRIAGFTGFLLTEYVFYIIKYGRF